MGGGCVWDVKSKVKHPFGQKEYTMKIERNMHICRVLDANL